MVRGRGALRHGRFENARRVFELGCGTGRLAARLLTDVLPPDAEYAGVDISGAMRALAARRLAPFGPRARVFDPGALPAEWTAPGACDRYLSTYVLDLLPEEEIHAALGDARRVLRAGGWLCLAGLTPGETPWGLLVTGLWREVHAWRPEWVGGCRPLRLAEYLPGDAWRIEHRQVCPAFGIASEVIVAR